MRAQEIELPYDIYISGSQAHERVFAHQESDGYVSVHASWRSEAIMQPKYGDCAVGRHSDPAHADVLVSASVGDVHVYSKHIRQFGYLGIKYPMFSQRVGLAERMAERRLLARLNSM